MDNMHWIALCRAPDDPSAYDASSDTGDVLTCWALQFTPCVARVPDGLVLEVSGSVRLFGGFSALWGALLHPHSPVVIAYAAWGMTALEAQGRLWLVREGGVSAAYAQDTPLDQLPLEALAAAREHRPTLSRIGCKTWGDLRALPRGGLVRRFGAALLQALDRAYGQAPEIYAWVTLPERFDASVELSSSVESAAAMVFGAHRLLAHMLVWLRARQSGVSALELIWGLDPRRSNVHYRDAHHAGEHQGCLVLRTAQPTQDVQHLQRLLAEHLAHVQLPAPVVRLRMRTVSTQALSTASYHLLLQDQRSGSSAMQLMENLVARLGAEQVRVVGLHEESLPEHMQQWSACNAQGASTSAFSADAHLAKMPANAQGFKRGMLPSWLLTVPQRLSMRHGLPHYHGPLTMVAGPHRLEVGWLEVEATLRDYFVAHSPQAGWLWIYRQRHGVSGAATDVWFLHGVFA